MTQKIALNYWSRENLLYLDTIHDHSTWTADGFTGPLRLSPMAFQRSLTAIGVQVPQPDRAVIAAGRKEPAHIRKDHGIDGFTAKSLTKLVLILLALLW